VWLLLHYYLTLAKGRQVNNMSKSKCCPLYCHGGESRNFALVYYLYTNLVLVLLYYCICIATLNINSREREREREVEHI